MTAPLPLGTRVRLRGSSLLGAIYTTPYSFRGELRVGVSWYGGPGISSAPVSSLALVTSVTASVPPEARPCAVGAMAGGAR